VGRHRGKSLLADFIKALFAGNFQNAVAAQFGTESGGLAKAEKFADGNRESYLIGLLQCQMQVAM